MKQILNSKRVMETGDHSKNGASLKSQTSRGNIIWSIVFTLIVFGIFFSCENPKSKVEKKIAEIHYDGVYVSEPKNNAKEFYRFYPNNIVVTASTSSESEPIEVSEWLIPPKDTVIYGVSVRISSPASVGNYCIVEDSLHFKCTNSEGGAVIYSGKINSDSIIITFESLINGNKGQHKCSFVKIDNN